MRSSGDDLGSITALRKFAEIKVHFQNEDIAKSSFDPSQCCLLSKLCVWQRLSYISSSRTISGGIPGNKERSAANAVEECLITYILN
jgi:hypothetical protein